MTARYLTRARLRELTESLSERDFVLLRKLASLRFASGSQLARLCFVDADGTPDHRAAKRALLRLTRLGVLARLPRPVGGIGGGSGGFVYYLNAAGQRLSIDRGWLPEGRPRRPSVPGRLFVGHAFDVAELHTRLVEADRAGQFKLGHLEAEPSCWRDTGGAILKPDTYLRLVLGDYEDSYFIEVDRGTEGSGAIRRQFERYLAYHQTGREQAAYGVFPKVLWLAADAERVRMIADLIAHQPEPARKLFAVAEFDNALTLIAKGEAADNALQSTL